MLQRLLASALVCGLIVTSAFSAKITTIQYQGLQSLSTMLAAEIAKIKVGDELESKAIDSAVLAFYNQGYFKDVYASFDKGALTFHFVEKPRVASVEIKGYGSEQEKQTLTTQMGIKKGETFDDQKIARAKEVLKSVLEYQGYYGSIVQEELKKADNADAYAIIFNVNRGDNILIRKAHYEGRKKLKTNKLESLSANKERDFMGWMWGLNDGKLRLQELEYDSLRIQDVYMRNGFLDASVSAPFLTTNFNNLSAQLYYKINEGLQYRVSDIEINLDNDVIPIATLQKALNVKKKEIFNIEDLRTDAQVLKRLIADKGYAFAQVRPDLDKDEQNALVKVIYHIETGSKVRIGDVLISGNTRTGDRIIRREILLAPGDEYSLSKIAESENALRRLGFFDNVKIDEKRVSEDSMDLLISVTEGRTGQLQFGLGYGSYGGLMINGSVMERNLFGTGQSGSIYANISTGTGQSYNFNYYGQTRKYNGRQFSGNITLSNPRVFDSKFSTSGSIYGNYYINYIYIEQSGGFSLNLGRLLTPTLRVSLGYDINVVKTYDFTSNLYEQFYSSKDQIFTDKVKDPNCTTTDTNDCMIEVTRRGLWNKDNHLPITSSITPTINFDNTDDYYFPKNGVIASTYAQFAGLGGTVRNIKAYAKLGLYYHLRSLLGIDLIARYKAQGGYIFRFDKEDFLPLNSTFYMGGVTTIRGFRAGSITPRNADGLWVGGDGMFSNSLELSYGILEAAKMRLALFADYGFLTFKATRGVADFKDYGILGSGNHDLEWRASMGLAIEWISPMGPLVIVIPLKRFNQKPGDYTSSFEFSMGTRF